MAEPLFADPGRLVLGTRKVPTSYTAEDVPWGISHLDRRNHLYKPRQDILYSDAEINRLYSNNISSTSN